MAGLPAGFQGVCLTPLPLPGGPLASREALHPAMEVLPAADVVVCGAGYNSYWETRALGLRAVFRPFKPRTTSRSCGRKARSSRR